jgi:hypothetical protein
MSDLTPASEPGRPGAGARLLAEVERVPVRWLWPDRIPLGKLTVVEGDPAVGKSTVVYDLAARYSSGAEWPDGQQGGGGGRVLLLSAEDDAADTIVPRLMAAGADLSRICLWDRAVVWDEDGERSVPITFPDHLPYLHGQVRSFAARLVIVDVLMAYLSAQIDSHKDQSVRVLLSRMSDLAAATGAAIVLVRHLNKGGSGPAIYRGGGSIGIIGAARAGFQVIADSDVPDRRLFTCVKSNLATKAPTLAYRLEPVAGLNVARVVWEDRPDPRSADELHAASAAAPTKFAAAAEWLDLYGATHTWEAQSADVIREAAEHGIARATLYRAAEHAGIVRSTRGGSGRWRWPQPD